MNIKEKENIKELLKDRQDLIIELLWQRDYEEIKKIIEMPEWKDKKFRSLLTSNIWKSNYEEIKKIIEMPEWNDEKFKGLLTSTIWNSSYKSIREKLNMEYWKDPRYTHLLVPSIFSISINNIKNGIELLEKYGISQFITNKCLRRKTKELELLIKYKKKENIELVVEEKNGNEKLNPILNSSNSELKEKYNMDIKKIEDEIIKIEGENR